MRSIVIACCGLLLPLSGASADDVDPAADIAAAVAAGKAGVAIRYRYEHVDQDGVAENADASTARLRLNYGTGSWNGWTAFGELDYVFDVLLRDFDSGGGTSPGRSQYPVVADPDGADLNQLYFDYAPSGDWKVRLGRQRILLDDQRFVGGVGWRQNEQTYDALTFDTNAFAKTTLKYSYVNWVRRIFGERSAAGKAKVDAHLLNAKVTINDDWSLVPYFYYLDYADAANASNSTATGGIRLEGSIPAGKGKLRLLGEIATQSDAGNNPVNYDARFFRIDALWLVADNLALGLALESLGGNSTAGSAFRTPLATLHGFQGWADKFLATPNGGIEDLYATVRYSTGDWNLTAIYHDFSAESGGGDYGTEFDVSAGRRLAKHYGVLVKAAFFSGDAAGFPDTTKVWLQLTANY